MDSPASTFGALLIGAVFALFLSGIVTTQAISYFKVYPDDPGLTKLLVGGVWTLDLLHSAFICSGLWHFLIIAPGGTSDPDFIPFPLGLTVIFTAASTFLVHCFFIGRIFRLSKQNWFILVPITVLAGVRLASATVTTAEMLLIQSFSGFRAQFWWTFTLGLALSCTIDIVIATSLYYFLRCNRAGSSGINSVIDLLMLYTVETGLLTCTATTICLIFWLAMPNNLVFMGTYFPIAKLYANSLVVALGSRQELREVRDSVVVQQDSILPTHIRDRVEIARPNSSLIIPGVSCSTCRRGNRAKLSVKLKRPTTQDSGKAHQFEVVSEWNRYDFTLDD